MSAPRRCTLQLFCLVMMGSIIQLLWHTWTLSACPYLIIGYLVLPSQCSLNAVDALIFRCLILGAPLEAYHMPRGLVFMMKNNFPVLMRDAQGRWITRDDLIQPAAEKRAAELRARLGVMADGRRDGRMVA